MKTIYGLDLGVASIGWAVISIDCNTIYETSLKSVVGRILISEIRLSLNAYNGVTVNGLLLIS